MNPFAESTPDLKQGYKDAQHDIKRASGQEPSTPSDIGGDIKAAPKLLTGGFDADFNAGFRAGAELAAQWEETKHPRGKGGKFTKKGGGQGKTTKKGTVKSGNTRAAGGLSKEERASREQGRKKRHKRLTKSKRSGWGPKHHTLKSLLDKALAKTVSGETGQRNRFIEAAARVMGKIRHQTKDGDERAHKFLERMQDLYDEYYRKTRFPSERKDVGSIDTRKKPPMSMEEQKADHAQRQERAKKTLADLDTLTKRKGWKKGMKPGEIAKQMLRVHPGDRGLDEAYNMVKERADKLNRAIQSADPIKKSTGKLKQEWMRNSEIGLILLNMKHVYKNRPPSLQLRNRNLTGQKYRDELAQYRKLQRHKKRKGMKKKRPTSSGFDSGFRAGVEFANR